MNNLCIDIGFNSLNKVGETICGDHVDIVFKDENNVVMVLADGLGSGVKAGILSTLTSKIISTMMSQDMSIEECVKTIAATLPVCQVRQIAYSTFTIIIIKNIEEAEIIQYDNPHVILLRDGKNFDYPKSVETIDGKTIYKSKFRINEKDTFVSFSDGAVHAGVGILLNFGWKHEDIIKFLEKCYEPNMTAKTITTKLLEKCNELYDNKPGDDVTVCTLNIRNREPVHLMIGPPASESDVKKMMSLFFSKPGKHIVCGGTTSTLAAEYLGKKLIPQLDFIDPKIPPIAKVEGVDLVTEGVITINKVVTYAEDYLKDNRMYIYWENQLDGASQIARILFEESTDINFYVGMAINPAHQNPNLPINFNIKMRLVEELSNALKKMGKKIKISYF